MSPPSSSIQKRAEAITFQVPDEDNDSVSNQSREDSVQVVESIHAYSVPSSEFDEDEDEDEVEEKEEDEEAEDGEEDEDEDEDEDEENEEDVAPSTPQTKIHKPLTPPTLRHEASKNLGTTPEHPIEVWAEPIPTQDMQLFYCRSRTSHVLTKGKSNNAGSSDMNPIDLEGEVPCGISDQGSEDEGPEILSSKKKTSEVINLTPPSAIGQYLTSKPLVVCASTLHCSDQHKESEPAAHRDGASDDNDGSLQSKVQSQAGVAVPTQESRQVKSISNPTDYFDSFQQDDWDAHNYLPEYPERSCIGGSSRPGLPGARPRVAFDLREVNTSGNTSGSAATRTNWYHRFSSNGIANQVTNSDAQRTVPRPPSPSDAALAKNANATALQGHWPLLKPGPAHLAHNDLPYLPYARDACQKEVAPWIDTYSVSSNQAPCPVSSNQAREGSFFDTPDPAWPPRYEDGPFSSHVQRGVSPDRSIYPFYRCSTSFLELNDRRLAKAAPPRATSSAEYDKLWATECPSSPVIGVNTNTNIAEESENHPKGNENHPSRLNIADIVNPLADTSRSLKRKADEISVDETDKHDFEQPLKSSQPVPPLEMDAEDTDALFDDAQPREILADSEHNLLRASSNEPITVPHQSPEVALGRDIIGPACKKRKTSGSSAIGVSRFVSGVLVGLAGAFAAFIATIPMSVQEEALREISRAV